MNNRTLPNLILVLALLSLGVWAAQAYAGVSSISDKETVDNNGVTYEQVSVQCRSQRNRMFLRKARGEKRWCDSVLGEFCFAKKLAAAQKLCSRQYASELEKSQLSDNPAKELVAEQVETKSEQERQPSTTKSVNIALLKQEEFTIEQKLIDLEARRLELQRREIALRKRKFALNPSVTKN